MSSSLYLYNAVGPVHSIDLRLDLVLDHWAVTTASAMRVIMYALVHLHATLKWRPQTWNCSTVTPMYMKTDTPKVTGEGLVAVKE